MVVSLVRSEDEFRTIGSAWNNLLRQTDFRPIFLTHAWMYEWWDVYKTPDRELFILLVHDQDSLVGIVPLMLTRKEGSINHPHLQFLGAPNSDYSDLIASDKASVADAFLSYLTRNSEWATLELDNLSVRSRGLTEIVRATKREGLVPEVSDAAVCPAWIHEGDSAGRAEVSFEKKRTIRNRINFFQNRLRCVVEDVSGERSAELLPYLFKYHINRWEGTPTPSKFVTSEAREFLRRQIHNPELSPHVRFTVLRKNDLPLAIFMNYEYDQTMQLFTLTNNPFYARKSPGRVLFHLQSERFIQAGFDLDFSQGDHEYKYCIANRVFKTHRMVIRRHALARLTQRTYRTLKKTGAGKRLVAEPGLAGLKRRIREAYVDHGVRDSLIKAGRKLGGKIVDSRVLCILSDERTDPCPAPDRSDIQIEVWVDQDMERIAGFLGFVRGSRQHRTIQERLESGGECYVAMQEGAPACMIWTAYGEERVEDANVTLHLGEGEVLLCEAKTIPWSSGSEAGSVLLRHVQNVHKERGLRVYGAALSGDLAALRRMTESRMTHVDSRRYLRILGIRVQ